MGSILSAISDDWDEYEALCKRHNEKMVDLYSTHYYWLNDIDRGKTKLSLKEYTKQRHIASLKSVIKGKEMEIIELKKQLKKHE